MSRRENSVNPRCIALIVGSLGTILFSISGQDHSPSPGFISPDKRWEYKCVIYYDGECLAQLVRAGTTDVIVNLDQDLEVSGSESKDGQVFWAPDSKRFAFNYSPVHAHHTQFETVAFYQLNADKWMQLPLPIEETQLSQLAELAKKHLLKGFNPHNCESNRDILKLRSWTDNDTAMLYAPCYDRNSGELNTAFLFTVKFDATGKANIVKTERLSGKQAEEK